MADTSLYPSITDQLEASAPDAMKLLQSLRSDYEAGRMPENVAERFVSLWNETTAEKQDTGGAIADLGVEVREVRQQLTGVEQELDAVVTDFTTSDTSAATLEPLVLYVRERLDATIDEVAVVEARTIDVREQVFDLDQHRVANIRELL